VPIGAEDRLRGLVDLTTRAAYEFHGAAGEAVTPVPLPGDLAELVEARRAELVERVRGHLAG
jgi:elongation factor G